MSPLIANLQVYSKTVHRTLVSCECKIHPPLVAIRCGVLVTSCTSTLTLSPPHLRLWRVTNHHSYDRMSPSFRSYMETLTATCAQPVFKSACEAGGYEVMSPRGSPLNKDFEFAPVHPVVRTHPVTGWKSLFAGVGLHVSRINDVYSYEDQMIRDYVMRLITRNHDGIARMHWTPQACAIWSNACTLHAATVSSPVAIKWNGVLAKHYSAGHTPRRWNTRWCSGVRYRRGALFGPCFNGSS